MRVTIYKGVNIYVDSNGEFFCNPSTNSDKKFAATFKSDSLAKIQKAIDSLNAEFESFDAYRLYEGSLTRVTINSKVGTRLFIDGKPIDQMSGKFFPLEVENSEQWPSLVAMVDSYTTQSRIFNAASEARYKLRTDMGEIAKQLPKL